jgi:hypothetical protein
MNRFDGERRGAPGLTLDGVELRYTTTVVDGDGTLILDVDDPGAWLRSSVGADLAESR